MAGHILLHVETPNSNSLAAAVETELITIAPYLKFTRKTTSRWALSLQVFQLGSFYSVVLLSRPKNLLLHSIMRCQRKEKAAKMIAKKLGLTCFKDVPQMLPKLKVHSVDL